MQFAKATQDYAISQGFTVNRAAEIRKKPHSFLSYYFHKLRLYSIYSQSTRRPAFPYWELQPQTDSFYSRVSRRILLEQETSVQSPATKISIEEYFKTGDHLDKQREMAEVVCSDPPVLCEPQQNRELALDHRSGKSSKALDRFLPSRDRSSLALFYNQKSSFL